MPKNKPKTNKDKFLDELTQKFGTTMSSWGFNVTRTKTINLNLENAIRVLNKHNRYDETFGDSRMFRCGIAKAHSSNVLTTESVIEKVINPSFDIYEFIDEVLQIEVATTKEGHTLNTTFISGKGQVTDDQLDKKKREYIDAIMMQ